MSEAGEKIASEKTESEKAASEKARTGKKKDVGTALRTAYDRVVNEEIPPDLLDLLGKLG